MQTFSQGHALVVGLGAYQDSAWNLATAAAETAAVAATLIDPAICAYPRSQVLLLQDQAATRAQILAGLAELAYNTTPGSTVMLFFSGHGAPGTDGSYYFATHETRFVERRIAAGTGLRADELTDALAQIEAERLVCVVNACQAGALGPAFRQAGPVGTMGAPLPDRAQLRILGSGRGRVLLTAARDWQNSHYLLDQPYSLFGQALLDALYGGSIESASGYIGLYELYGQVYAQVRHAAGELHVQQEPVLTILEGVGPYPLAIHQRAHTGWFGSPRPPVQPTPPPNTAVAVVDPAQVLAAGGQLFQAQGAQQIDQSTNQQHGLINFNRTRVNRDVTISNVAGRDLINLSGVSRAAAGPSLLQLAEEIAQLPGLAHGLGRHAATRLQQAHQASQANDYARMRELITDVRMMLVSIGQHNPAVARLVGVLDGWLG